MWLCRLLNYILTEKHGFRCAVILNEFGDSAGIEKALLNDTQVMLFACFSPNNEVAKSSMPRRAPREMDILQLPCNCEMSFYLYVSQGRLDRVFS